MVFAEVDLALADDKRRPDGTHVFGAPAAPVPADCRASAARPFVRPPQSG